MATIPGREEACLEALESLIDQVDEIHLALNQYKALPDWVPPGVCAVLTAGGDEEKFRSCPALEPDVYFFSCDDDLVYPPDYVSRTLARSHRERREILTYHGRVLATPVTQYYLSGRKYHWFHAVPEDASVHVGGTGVMAFLIRHFRPLPGMFPSEFPLMADVHVAVEAQRQRIPIRALQHPAAWIRPSARLDPAASIFATFKDRDALQVERLNEIAEWCVHVG
jgi:hypothetical protein